MLDVRYLISLVDTAVSYLVFVRATPLDRPMAHFHCFGSHYLRGVSEASPTSFSLQRFVEVRGNRMGHGVVLLLGLIILGGWFFSGRGTNRRGAVLGWSGGIRLIALAFAMMIVVAFAIVIPAQVFLSNTFRRPRNQPMNSLTN